LGVKIDSQSEKIDPHNNPQFTDGTGHYGWDVAGGCWYVVVEKEGYEDLTSPVVGVPPAVTDLDLELSALLRQLQSSSTTEPVTVAVDSGTSSTMTYTDTQDLPTRIEIPTGAVTTTTTLVYTSVEQVSDLPAGYAFAGHAFTLEAYRDGAHQDGFVFEKPITVTIYYSDDDVAGLDEGTLDLHYWDGSAWSTDGITPTERNPDQNYAVFTIAHLSDFALTGQQSTTAVGGVAFVITPEADVKSPARISWHVVALAGLWCGLVTWLAFNRRVRE
jgi:hypothetical protein